MTKYKKVVCPKCGRKGRLMVKMVTNSYHTRLYACLYVKHAKERPKWCYLSRIKKFDLDVDDFCTWYKVPNKIKDL